jgi:P4 family phage/plasmid primase-like protien
MSLDIKKQGYNPPPLNASDNEVPSNYSSSSLQAGSTDPKAVLDELMSRPVDQFFVESYLNEMEVDFDPEAFEECLNSLDPLKVNKVKPFLTLPSAMNSAGKLQSTYTQKPFGRYYTSNRNLQGLPKPVRKSINRIACLIIEMDISHSFIRFLCNDNHEVSEKLFAGVDIYDELGQVLSLPRKVTKILLLAYIFGASQKTLEDKTKELGNKLSVNFDLFLSRTWPKFKKHLDRLIVLVSSKCPVLEPHKALSYLLMKTEARWLERVIHVVALDAKSTQLLPETILAVHDALVCVSNPIDLNQHIHLMKYVMTECLKFEPALAKDAITVKYGRSWGEMDNDPIPMGHRPTTPDEWCTVAHDYLSNGRGKPITNKIRASIKILAGRHDQSYFEQMINSSQLTRVMRRSLIKMGQTYRGKLEAQLKKQQSVGLPVLPSSYPIDVARYYRQLKAVNGFLPLHNEEVGVRTPNLSTMSYDPCPIDLIGQEIQSLHGEEFLIAGKPKKLRMVSERTAVDAYKTAAYEGDFTFDFTKGICSFPNGDVVFNESTCQLEHNDRSLNSKVLSENLYDVDYDPLAKCSRFLKFLNEIWPEADGVLKIDILQEFVGLCLLGLGSLAQKHLFFYGPKGSNGKSELLKIITGLFPKDAKSSVSPLDWFGFNLHGLLGSRLNTFSELPVSKWMNDDLAKAILTGDPITIQRKGLKSLQNVLVLAGHIISANSFPPSMSNDKAFFRRWVILSFNQVFEGASVERNLHKNILDTEKPGIITWALQGAERFLSREPQSFTHLPSSDALIDQWRAESSSAHEFIQTQVKSSKEETSLKELFEAYKEWCVDEGRKWCGKGKFKKVMEQEYDYPCVISSHAKTRCFNAVLGSTYIVKDEDPLDGLLDL